MAISKFEHKFVELIPDTIEEGILYISLKYNTIIHNCACGCGEEVVTPISPNGWKLIYNGEDISLRPSIGNWSYKCRSHYLISNSKVIWAYNDTYTTCVPKKKKKSKFFKKFFERKN